MWAPARALRSDSSREDSKPPAKGGTDAEAPVPEWEGGGGDDQNGMSSSKSSAGPEVVPAGIAGPLAGAVAGWPEPLPFGLSRNWTRPPGTRRISVENRSPSSPGFDQRRVWSFPSM